MKISLQQQYLECAHCHAEFVPTYKQLQHLKYGECKNAFCSPICRITHNANALRKIRPTLNCPICHKDFQSKKAKKYCSLKCYNDSPEFKERAKQQFIENGKKIRLKKHLEGTENRNCLECNTEFFVIKSSRKTFCNKSCWRRYLAKRFDRWIANPQTMALPQAYDEFLTQEDLPCLIDGCDWKGKFLALHMNQTHGVPADEFKRAAGFNLHTGVVPADFSEMLAERNCPIGQLDGNRSAGKGTIRRYKSLEAREHIIKGQMLRNANPDNYPERCCLGCGVKFKQTTAFGQTKYHSIECRNKHYREKAKLQSTNR